MIKNIEQKDIKANWLPVNGYEGLYEVSDTGKVWSCRRNVILRPADNGDGYLIVLLTDGNGNRKCHLVSRLVATEFIPNPHNLPEVNHILEFEKHNNYANNLEWITSKENCNHGSRNKRISTAVICITTGKVYQSMSEAGRKTGISQGNISLCCQGKIKSIGKHPETGEKLIWKYYM